MHPTVAQNKTHRADAAWTKSKGAVKVEVEGKVRGFTSEYVHESGWAIRKTWEYVALPWFVFNAEGEVVHRAHSLTWAKLYFDHESKQEA
jgi:hypothetical protein